MAAKVLLVEDDPSLREALGITLELGGYAHRAVDCGEAALIALEQEPFGLVISDVNMPGMDGHELLASIRKRYPQIPVLLMTAFGAVAPGTLLELLGRHVNGALGPLGAQGPVACEPSSQRLLDLAARVAQSDSTVLISGESGTGKEVLARYIHQRSPRGAKPFIAINCAAIPDNMLEATLFGHEKGAFTGAIASQPGKFEQADGGTLLLDEISEMPLALQAKLLRVLQEREVERVGGRRSIALDIRVLATTNRDLAAEVAAGRFREDLFYRLSVFPLAWPPLRERPADILPLAERLLAGHARKMRQIPARLSSAAQRCLLEHGWPGNVRELDNAIQRALILQQGGVIQPEDLCLLGSAGAVGSPLAANAASLPTEASAADGEVGSALGDDLRRREFQLIIDTLRAERGRRKETADRLGISARTLRYKLAQMRDAGVDVEALLYAS